MRTTQYLEAVREPENVFLVAVDGVGTIRGYAHLRWGPQTKPFVDPDDAGLKELYVDPDAWGTGIGTTLLNAGIDRLPPDLHDLTLEMLAGTTGPTRSTGPVASSGSGGPRPKSMVTGIRLWAIRDHSIDVRSGGIARFVFHKHRQTGSTLGEC